MQTRAEGKRSCHSTFLPDGNEDIRPEALKLVTSFKHQNWDGGAGRVHNDHDQQDQSIRVQLMGFDSWRGMETAHSRPRITALTYSGRMSILELAYKGKVKHWLRSNTLKMGCILPEHMLYTELESCMGCFPGGSDGKVSACSVGDQGSIPGLE
ncbi:unnamed protein product [Rangifer tarandus platyrhynchus]|uniref:Uncharacterized protein n=2 Tax=Rangifer tarandus platyrhynchus TaxID=3082113 RepID=A0ABN8ZIE7_RANTA|nr:unnamed protein product [Rangifer tarandus platyrhynchus]